MNSSCLIEKASEKTCYLGRSCGKLYNAQLILHRYQRLRNIINTSLFVLATMQKTVKIVVGKTLERPPLNSSGRNYKLYLPKDIIIDIDQYKLVNM